MATLRRPRFDLRRITPVIVALSGVVAALCISTPGPSEWEAMRHLAPSWTGDGDLDTRLIHGGLLRAPHLADTLRWWYSSWVGQVPFYRPLTSYVFWIEWKAFGNREYLYLIPTILWHVMACALFGVLAYRLAERYRFEANGVAGIVGALGYAGVLSPQRATTAAAVSGAWKNQPDSLAAICIFAALLSYLRAREGRRGMLAAGVAFYLAACGFKEIAVPLPLVCAALELDGLTRERLALVLRRLAPLFAATLVFLVLRIAAIRGVGYTYGTNRAWLYRTLAEGFGPFGAPFVTGYWPGPLLALWLFFVFAGCWLLDAAIRSRTGRPPERLWLGLGAAVLAIGGAAVIGMLYLMRADANLGRPEALESWAVALQLLFDPYSLHYTVPGLLALAAATTLVRNRPAAFALAAAWTWCFLLPLVASPGPQHRYYLSQGGYVLCYSFAMGVWAWEAQRRLRRARARRPGASAPTGAA